VATSQAFTAMLRENGSDPATRADAQLGTGELEEWLRLFGETDEGG
jgi:hypothetical protein